MSKFRLFFCLLGVFCLTLCLTAQGQSVRKQADLAYGGRAFERAIPLYEQELMTGDLSLAQRRNLLIKLADSYRQIQDYIQAERTYRQLVGESPELPADQYIVWLHYAQTLGQNGKFKESAEAFERYETKPQTAVGYLPALGDDTGALANDRGEYALDFLPINTPKAEFSPMFYKSGLVYVSANGNHGRGFLQFGKSSFLDLRYLPDLSNLTPRSGRIGTGQSTLGRDYYSGPTANDVQTISFMGGRQMNAGWGYGNALSPASRFDRSLNTKYHEGPATFSHDGTRVYFTRNNYNNGETGRSSDGVNKLKLYTAVQQNGVWQTIEELPFNSDEYSVGHPALGRLRHGAPDELLYFASDMPGGFGGTDIYVCHRTDGAWGKPVNLGGSVNSKGNELFPFADEKGNLYFSSDGLPGKGALDVFYASLTATGDGVNWVKNLPEPINSPADDFGIITDGTRQAGYFSSNRKNGGADDDLYHFARTGEQFACRELIVQVYDAQTNAPLPEVSLTISQQNESGEPRRLKTDPNGMVRFCIEADNDFTVLAAQTGFQPNRAGLSTRDLVDRQPLQLALPLVHEEADDTTEPAPEPAVNEPVALVATQAPAGDAPVMFSGHVRFQATGKPAPGAIVTLQSRCDSTRLNLITDLSGQYSFPLKSDCNDYLLTVRKAGYASFGSRVGTDSGNTADLTLFRTGDVVRIDNVLYDVNKADIRPDAAAELDRIVTLMTEHPTMVLELRSHTDSRSSAQYNKTLSAARAKAAVAYLVDKGIAANRLRSAGFGESLPVNKCKDGVACTEEEYQQNRRTEIRVVTF
jgi:outer membrane protein OmpA-like peptidoglycan-associated protein/tetratricopeptide (TPR) repeat protein